MKPGVEEALYLTEIIAKIIEYIIMKGGYKLHPTP